MPEPFNKHVVHLTPDDFDEIKSWELGKNAKSGCTFVMFHVDWCGHCQRTKPVWNQLAEMATFFQVSEFNCEKYPAHYQKILADVPDMIQGFPTLVVYSHGKPVHIYDKERELNLLFKTCMDACSKKGGKNGVKK